MSEKSLEERYKEIIERYNRFDANGEGTVFFGWSNFKMLHGHFGMKNLSDFSDMISMNSRKLVIPPSIVAIDETTTDYNPSIEKMKQHEEIPIKVTPSKPHPVGFWINSVCTKLEEEHRPYALHLLPFFHQPDAKPSQVVQTILDAMEESYPKQIFCFVLDSRFDNKQTIDIFQKSRHYFVVGGKNRNHSVICDILQSQLDFNEWRAFNTPQNILYSGRLIRGKRDKIKLQLVITNVFKVNEKSNLKILIVREYK